MSEPTAWRELHRTSNPQELLAIVTSIAAMEFDVRCVDVHGRMVSATDPDDVEGPRIIQVREEDHAALLDVLDEIVAEQDEFDAMLEQRSPWTVKRLLLSLAAIVGAAIVLLMTAMPR